MKDGDMIIFPTDTVYGLATRLYDDVGLKNIFELKKRDKSKTIPILVSKIVDINPIAHYNDDALKLMTSFWPGPLTIILKSTQDFFKKTGEATVAVRIPNHYIALNVIDEFGPMRTTSVNQSGERELNCLTKIKEKYGDKVFHIYGEYEGKYGGIPSTIIDMSKNELKVIREGTITFEQLTDALNK